MLDNRAVLLILWYEEIMKNHLNLPHTQLSKVLNLAGIITQIIAIVTSSYKMYKTKFKLVGTYV